ncbi:hypothetical protein BH11BAC4_BH11BAC4_25450 [soil metagenome]
MTIGRSEIGQVFKDIFKKVEDCWRSQCWLFYKPDLSIPEYLCLGQ